MRRAALPRLAACIVMGSALPAMAGSFAAPEGCTTFLTVQSKGCRVSNHYTCSADAAGDQWRTDFDQEGPYFTSRIDSEAQWVESFELDPPVRQTLDPNPQDPASFSGLLATGNDSFIFGLSDDTGERTRVRGSDRLTGRQVVIDGITLQETEFNFTETDLSGNVLRRSRGNEYIHPDWRLFFSGPSQWDGGDGTYLPLDGSPIQFIFPGEPGFASTQPLFDCDAVMSSLPFTPKS
ncbi:hypothetical protein G5V65_10270 [Rhodobacter sp. HX-7-19]|uniref:DUF3298 domain-containing protein n=1 Tax=Paragemmobacter kunshanensis TaxID=2583234 RepID=A0A6M1U815_9RHOB|nr:hypothetical protein [Rhodobacter kunshanensis]NGQ91283.1 hypothetical protein [Rhodobacter kunshanensis]